MRDSLKIGVMKLGGKKMLWNRGKQSCCEDKVLNPVSPSAIRAPPIHLLMRLWIMTHWKVQVSAGNGLLRPDRQGAPGSRLHLQRMCPDMHDSRRYTATSTTVTGQKLSHCSHNRQAKSITQGKIPLRPFNIKVALAKGRWGNIGKMNIFPPFPLIDSFQKQLLYFLRYIC